MVSLEKVNLVSGSWEACCVPQGRGWTDSDSPRRLKRRKNARLSCPSCSGRWSLQLWLSGPLSLLWLRTSRLALLCVRYQRLEEASASLRERIRHLDDMVHCQQKKVKQMVEEVSPCGRPRARRAACRGDTSAREPALTLSSVFCGSRVNVAQREISSSGPPGTGDYPSNHIRGSQLRRLGSTDPKLAGFQRAGIPQGAAYSSGDPRV